MATTNLLFQQYQSNQWNNATNQFHSNQSYCNPIHQYHQQWNNSANTGQVTTFFVFLLFLAHKINKDRDNFNSSFFKLILTRKFILNNQNVCYVLGWLLSLYAERILLFRYLSYITMF